jgi:hypothetical protein
MNDEHTIAINQRWSSSNINFVRGELDLEFVWVWVLIVNRRFKSLQVKKILTGMDNQLIEVSESRDKGGSEGLSWIGWYLNPDFVGSRVWTDIHSDLEQWVWQWIGG